MKNIHCQLSGNRHLLHHLDVPLLAGPIAQPQLPHFVFWLPPVLPGSPEWFLANFPILAQTWIAELFLLTTVVLLGWPMLLLSLQLHCHSLQRLCHHSPRRWLYFTLLSLHCCSREVISNWRQLRPTMRKPTFQSLWRRLHPIAVQSLWRQLHPISGDEAVPSL